MKSQHNPTYEIRIDTNDDGYAYRHELKVIRNGKLLWSQVDGGEPEDNSFVRDWSWIKPALEEAYRLGREDAAQS